MDISSEHLRGLDDVRSLMQAVMDGSYSQDGVIDPEPTSSILQKQIEHTRIMVRLHPDSDLDEYAAVADRAQLWMAGKP